MNNSPIISVPGIKGTKLININSLGHDIIWSGLQSVYESIHDLALQEDAEHEINPLSIIERGNVEDLAYAQAFYMLREKVNPKVYIFAYDWRKSCVYNGRKLLDFVRHIKDKLNFNARKQKQPDRVENFNFVTHSMGGLVFSCFLKELNHDYSLMDQAVLTVPPFLGAIDILVALIIGEGGVELSIFNKNDDFRKICRSFPSSFELLPVYKGAVENDSGEDYSQIKGDDSFPMIFMPKYWQSNLVETNEDQLVEKRRLIDIFKTNLHRWAEFRRQGKMLDLRQLPPEVAKRILIICGT